MNTRLKLKETRPHLSQSDEEVEDVGVVVEHGARVDVRGELRLALRVERLVEVGLARVECVLAQQRLEENKYNLFRECFRAK